MKVNKYKIQSETTYSLTYNEKKEHYKNEMEVGDKNRKATKKSRQWISDPCPKVGNPALHSEHKSDWLMNIKFRPQLLSTL